MLYPGLPSSLPYTFSPDIPLDGICFARLLAVSRRFVMFFFTPERSTPQDFPMPFHRGTRLPHVPVLFFSPPIPALERFSLMKRRKPGTPCSHPISIPLNRLFPLLAFPCFTVPDAITKPPKLARGCLGGSKAVARVFPSENPPPPGWTALCLDYPSTSIFRLICEQILHFLGPAKLFSCTVWARSAFSPLAKA